MAELHTLYAITHSLFSGRARSYLIKNGIAFRELSTGHESFKADVLPQGKLPTIPTLVTPDGDVIRDGSAIVEHFESNNGRPCQPTGPKQKIISALFDVIGMDGLLRPAMHYRWNYADDNLSFVHHHFYYSQRDMPTRGEKTDYMMNRMRTVAQLWGVNEDSRELVEALYLEYLDALNSHLDQWPYLLGWRPCVGDFGLLGPMYAHLGRDPMPARLMQQRAVRVYRWVERMNRPDQDAPEFFNAGSDFIDNDEVPESLLTVLKILAEDFIPESRAAADSINHWLSENKPESGEAVDRMLGKARFEVRGQTLEAVTQPMRFFLLQRVQAHFMSLNEADKSAVHSMLTACSMDDLLNLKLIREIEQSGNLEVWV